MVALPQYTYVFAVAMVFAFLDAWNIGANDVANAFATSIASRSLSLKQAMVIAAIMEFAGAVLAGARVAGTIRNNIIQVRAFTSAPSVLMMGMLCALIGSSTFLTVATKIGLPVSTTHCIIGGIIGIGFATVGANGVDWSWRGVSQVFAAWGIAPCVSAAFAALIFLITKYFVLRAKKPLQRGMITVPFYFGLTSGILTMLIVWKGSPALNLSEWTDAQTLGCIFGVAVGCALLSIIFLLPYIQVRLVREDWTVKRWEMIKGPLLLKRGPPPPIPEGVDANLVPDYYAGHMTREQLEQGSASGSASDLSRKDEESVSVGPKTEGLDSTVQQRNIPTSTANPSSAPPKPPLGPNPPSRPRGSFANPRHWFALLHWAFFRGVNVDVVAHQVGTTTNEPKGLTKLLVGKNLADKHARVKHYDPKVEHLFSFLQVLTAATASFAHGANDVANAMGPLAAINTIWETNVVGSRSDVPIWVLVYGGAAISIGCWTYGYNLIRNLGNRITLHSPCRGFSMELGAALTVVMATRLSLPVSTTQCIIGATVGVGLCAGDLRAINWRMVGWSYAGWFITLPCTAIVSGLLMAFVIRSPRFPA